MTIESAIYLNTLNDDYPEGSSAKSEGDNHIRQLKTVLQATFPNVTGAIAATDSDLGATAGAGTTGATAFKVATQAASSNSTLAASTAQVQLAILAASGISAVLPGQTSNERKFLRTDGTNASWAFDPVNRVARTSNTILGASDHGKLIDITSGTFSQTFDAAATLGDGWFIYLKNSGTGDITLDPNASELIDGLATFVMYPGEVRLVQCDGSALRSVVMNGFYKTFTASGDFTKPPGYNRFEGLLWGGGGSGRKSAAAAAKSGGGGGACAPITFQSGSFSATEAVVIGAGGTGQVTATTDGNVGGDSTFNGVTAYGGPAGETAASLGGNSLIPSAIAVATNTGGANSTLCAYYGGGAGLIAATAFGRTIYGGGGGGGITAGDVLIDPPTTVYGGAGGAAVLAADGVAGTAPGGGGGATETGTSGAGARGELRIWGII